MKVSVRDVTKRFGRHAALAGVSVDLPDGELVALLGPSGSGKTTLLRTIAGIEIPEAGRIWFGDEDVTERPIQKRNVGFVNSLFNVTKQVIESMVERGFGRIINISSVNGQKGQFGQVNYSTAKAGIHGFTMALAQEVASKGVTVNTVSPGYIGTDMVRAIKPEILEKIVTTIPVRRLGTPEEIGAMVTWIAGDDSCFATGADFSVNGGLHMG